MTILALHHVQLAMPPDGESRATDFYEGILGIPRVAKPAHLEARGGCWFESSSVRVHLGVEPGFRTAEKAHTAFLVDDLDGLRRSLADAHVPIIDDEPLGGFDRFYIADPFGNRIEILASDGHSHPE